MSAIGQLEADIVARIGAALTLPGQSHPVVDVRAWPERAREHKMTHPRGCAFVIYKGSKFAPDASGPAQLVAYAAEFELGLISRTLREPNLPDVGAGLHEAGAGILGAGIYDLLETCRTALLGWRPAQAAGAVRLRSEDFDDYSEGTWGYSVRFGVPMLTVATPDDCCTGAAPLTSLGFASPFYPPSTPSTPTTTQGST